MKWIDILNSVDKSETNETNISGETLAEDILVYYGSFDYKKFESSVVGYYINSHLCTDTIVGDVAIFMNGELIGIESRECRKCPREYRFVSEEAAEKLISFLRECMTEEPRRNYIVMTEEEKEENISPYFMVNYTEELLQEYYDRAFLNGNPVTVIGDATPDGYVSTKVYIKDSDGKQSVVDISTLLFKMKIEE